MFKNEKTYTFHVNGMHCQSCVLMIDGELSELENISLVKANLSQYSVTVTGVFDNDNPVKIAEQLSERLAKHGYSLSVEKQQKSKNWHDFKLAIPIALLFALGFVLLQKIGLVNLINTDQVSYTTAFLIGLIASLSTCMAVVGGLVLSMSATFAKEGDKIRPQLLFHLGRLISFFIFGGVIGSLGAVFQLNSYVTFILSIVIGLVMLLLGFNLLDIFSFTKKWQPSMPKFLSRQAVNISKFNHTFTPFLIGIATFFLPCGFTQSMQIYTLSTGNFWAGSLTMLAFALGTFPVLAIISFSSFSIQNHSKAGVFFKTAGLIVIMFALFNLINSLVVIGLLPPIFNF